MQTSKYQAYPILIFTFLLIFFHFLLHCFCYLQFFISSGNLNNSFHDLIVCSINGKIKSNQNNPESIESTAELFSEYIELKKEIADLRG